MKMSKRKEKELLLKHALWLAVFGTQVFENACWYCLDIQDTILSSEGGKWFVQLADMYRQSESLAYEIADALGIKKSGVEIAKVLGISPNDIPF